MDIKYPIENEYMKCVLQINGFNGPCPWVGLGRVRGGATVPLKVWMKKKLLQGKSVMNHTLILKTMNRIHK